MDFDEIDDYEGGFPVEEFQRQQTPPIDNSNSEDDYLISYLKTKGIEDPNRILFEGENEGETIERSWNDLTDEEKFNILNTPSNVEDNHVPNSLEHNSDEEEFQDEIAFLKQLKENGVTLQQYLENIQSNQEPTYKVDDLSDEELFLLDLESRVGELTEEQGAEYLNLAKQNEDLFKKQVEGIRKEYKQKEDETTQRELAAQEYAAQEQFAQTQRIISGAIDNLTSVGNLELNLEDVDKEDLAEFILSRDANGQNYLEQALQDPETLVKVAWFILNGDEAFNNVEDYFTKLIKRVSEAQYKKGYEDGLKNNPQIVISNHKQTPQFINPNNKSELTLEDLD